MPPHPTRRLPTTGHKPLHVYHGGHWSKQVGSKQANRHCAREWLQNSKESAGKAPFHRQRANNGGKAQPNVPPDGRQMKARKKPGNGKNTCPGLQTNTRLAGRGITLFCLPGNFSVANHTIPMGRMPQPAGERHRGRDRRCRSFLHLQPQTATSAQRRHEPRKAGRA